MLTGDGREQAVEQRGSRRLNLAGLFLGELVGSDGFVELRAEVREGVRLRFRGGNVAVLVDDLAERECRRRRLPSFPRA